MWSSVSSRTFAGGVAFALGGALTIGACVKYEKSENPLSPTLAGPLPGVTITAPNPVQPSQNSKIPSDQQPVTLSIENASSNSVRPFTYRFEVAVDGGFTNVVLTRDGIQPTSGRTSLRLPDALATGRVYYWRARAQDGANTGPYSAVASFMVYTPVTIGKPIAASPTNNATTSNTHPAFTIGNAPRSGPVGAITYMIEVSPSGSFSPLYAIWQVGEQPGQTTLNAPGDLPGGTQLFWHVRGADPSNVGPWSDPASFATPAAAPAPPPPGGGGPACGSRQPIDIVTCHRAAYPALLSPAQAPNLLRDIAHDLNTGGPAVYGLLVKTGGNNCSGFACDIICRASDHEIWDVFVDGPDATTNYSGTAQPSWQDKGTNGSTCQVIP